MTPNGVTWGGHSTVLIELGGARLLTDPVLRAARCPSAPARRDAGSQPLPIASTPC